MLNFPLMRTFVLGSRHAALAYKAQRLKMQKLADWKPALSIRKQNSSHLQDIRNTIWSCFLRISVSTATIIYAKQD